MQKTNAEYGEGLKRLLDGTPVKVIIMDLSAASFIVELNKRGFIVIQADNAVEDGIRLMATLLNTERIALSQSHKNMIMEFVPYIRDLKAAGRGEDKPIKQYDHAMDAVRYPCYAILNNKTVRAKKKSDYGLH